MVVNIVAGFLYSCSTTMDARLFWASIILLSIYAEIFIVLPRIRDIGMSAWWLLVALIPGVDVIFGIILLFRAPARLSRTPASSLAAQPTAS